MTAARTGSGGLLVTNRSASWQGAGLSVFTQATPGVFFNYAVWVRLAPLLLISRARDATSPCHITSRSASSQFSW